MAVGISCAGTANKEALDLLTPMLADQTDFVRQGALVSKGRISTGRIRQIDATSLSS